MRLSLAAVALPLAAAYSAHPMLLKAVEQQGCALPSNYTIRDFVGQTNGTNADADASSPTYIAFAYADAATQVQTRCQFNATSKSTTPEGLTPRFACENRDVKFIWQPGQLTMVERACPNPQGTPLYEASGSVTIQAPCKAGRCVANATEYTGRFASLSPVRDPTSFKMAYQMMEIE
ncbi:hypothetical protein ISF_04424 [Cordyceps fumosorosea ARSEF 2679]|uniref:AA1-like domain-containing protein n=1 Tax=Cordyceps fumosorosea (strain ARSEF 2679) TaxID=1081104 RepID=A0A167XII2_CORFA|nr:hypothetical protein ISF_04424 [Cordyceps fumosorosea ARSEF 2679]OAA65014.1 hypothetical protein ISF_04424 [Cordyceps fumosorosea ARSEF 2679]